jgi:hypothetical protein
MNIISDKTRKLLWGKSGNKCAYCRTELTADEPEVAIKTVVGEECHINSPQTNGPRYNPQYPKEKQHDYENLILLCRTHHKIVDDNEDIYTAEILREMKRKHIKLIENMLREEKPSFKMPNPPKFSGHSASLIAERLNTGRDVFGLIAHAYSHNSNYDEPESREELDLIKDFMSYVEDADVLIENPSAMVEYSFQLSEIIKGLQSLGLYVYGAREILKMHDDSGSTNWPNVYIVITRRDLPGLTLVFSKDHREFSFG